MITLIVVVIAVLILLPVAVYHSARTNKQFTFVRTGEGKFVVSGEGFDRFLMDAPGYAYEPAQDEIIQLQGPPQQSGVRQSINQNRWEWVRRFAGIYYVSLIYPIRKIHTWKFEWDKQTKEASKNADSDTAESYRIVHRNEYVDSLFIEFPYPLHSHNLELKGGGSVDIKGRFVLRIIKPRYLVFTLNGTWYPAAMNALAAKKADFAKNRTLQDMFDPDKTNAKEFNKWFVDDPFILIGSIQIVEAIFDGFEQTGSKEEREALGKRKVSEIDIETGKNRGLAKAAELKEASVGEAALILAKGTATATAARLLGDALGHQREKLGDTLMEHKLRADTVGSFQGSALSLGGSAGHQVLVTTDQKKEGDKS